MRVYILRILLRIACSHVKDSVSITRKIVVM